VFNWKQFVLLSNFESLTWKLSDANPTKNWGELMFFVRVSSGTRRVTLVTNPTKSWIRKGPESVDGVVCSSSIYSFWLPPFGIFKLFLTLCWNIHYCRTNSYINTLISHYCMGKTLQSQWNDATSVFFTYNFIYLLVLNMKWQYNM
jgi:hypothetical protein